VPSLAPLDGLVQYCHKSKSSLVAQDPTLSHEVVGCIDASTTARQNGSAGGGRKLVSNVRACATPSRAAALTESRTAGRSRYRKTRHSDRFWTVTPRLASGMGASPRVPQRSDSLQQPARRGRSAPARASQNGRATDPPSANSRPSTGRGPPPDPGLSLRRRVRERCGHEPGDVARTKLAVMSIGLLMAFGVVGIS
jgi:hypothetical protein